MDIVSKEKRSEMMSRIRGKDTVPEKQVRALLHRMGYRFRLYVKNLPGQPDIVLPKYRTVILVHGCFWHRHLGCKYAYQPKSRKEFWQKKFQENIERDKQKEKALQFLGWKVIIIWECELEDPKKIEKKLKRLIK